jgi:hypothetical protein
MELERIRISNKSARVVTRLNQERKRSLLVLILKYLQGTGYVKSHDAVSSESGISLDGIELVGDIDLVQVLQVCARSSDSARSE